MTIYKNLKKALVIANHPLFDKDFSFIDSLLKSEDIKNLILTVPQKIKLLNGAVATGDSDIFSAIYNLKITEEITKDEKVKFLEWAILAKEPSIVSDIYKLKSTEEITKEQQKKLIPLATKSKNIDIINCIKNYNAVIQISKEEAHKISTIKELNGPIAEILNFTGYIININNSENKEPPICDDKKPKNNWTKKFSIFCKTNRDKYAARAKDSMQQLETKQI